MKSIVIAVDPAVDLAVAASMVGGLEAYLLHDDLYQTIVTETPNGTQRNQMTGGDLLTRLYRLQQQRAVLQAEQIQQLEMLQQAMDEICSSLQTRFRQKLQADIRASLNMLRWFLQDCPTNLRQAAIEFPFEMRNRQRMEECVKAVGEEIDEELIKPIETIDKQIQSLTVHAPFIWATALEPMFPKDTYWYLYRAIVEVSD
ncbi:MAG: hypothetical protein AAF702_10015 [Chloroflexota bacterium]